MSRRCTTIRTALAAMVLLGACSPPTDRGGFDFARMRQQSRRGTWDADTFFADGMAMRTPPPHIVTHQPRPPGVEVLTAWMRDSAHLDRGRRQFAISCAPCHGDAGLGGGRVAINLLPYPPPSLRTAAVAAISNDSLLRIVTRGRGRMPSFGWQLDATQWLSVLAWVRHLATQPLADSLAVADSLRAAGVGQAMARWRALDSLRRREPAP